MLTCGASVMDYLDVSFSTGLVIMIRKETIKGLHWASPQLTDLARTSWLLALIITVIFSATIISSAKTNINNKDEKTFSKSGSTTIDVSNFGKVADFYYRGAQPKDNEYVQLSAIGIKTIIDLRDDPKEFAKTMAEQAGLKYVNLPMSDKSYPAPEIADKFLSLVNDKTNWPVYVHCAGGRHRTGAMTAIFRMKVQGWKIDQAYDEMKEYDFYTRWGHKAMKKFVFDYYRELSQKKDDSPIRQLDTSALETDR